MDTKKLRQKILDLAIRGKLVPQDPNDEPASVLIERIRAEKEQLIKEGKIKRSKKSAATDKSHYENVPFEIPESWCWCSLSELCIFLSRGKSPKYSDERLFPVFAQKCNLKDGGVSLDQARFLDPSTIGKWGEDYKLKSGDVLVNSTGTGTVGRTRLFDECCLGEYPFVVPDSHVSVVRTVTEIDSFYIWSMLSSNWGQQYLEDNLAGSTNQKELYIGVLEDMFIPLPPKNEQKKIAKEIARWEKYVDNIDVIKTELSNYVKKTKSKILDLAISGKLVPQDPNDESAIELLKRINPGFEPCDNSHYENLPENWCLAKVKDVFVINPRNKAEDNTIAGFIPMTLIDDGYSNTFSYEKREWGSIKTGFTHFADGDVAVAKISPCLENRKSIVLRDLPNGIGAGTTELHVFRSSVVVPEYALYFFKSEYFISKCVGTFNGVVGQQRVGKNIIEETQIPIPPINEQTKIVSTIETIFTQLNTITAEL